MDRLRSPVLTGLTLALILTATLQTVSSDEKCRTGCQGVSPSTFKYEVGTTYKYTYEGSIEITLSTAEGQKTGTQVKADVLLTQLSDCNQLLRLQNVHVYGSDGKAVSGKIENIEKPIRLNFHDGHLEDSICTETGDTQNSLNVKRAVASLFQAVLKHNHETDVFGLCPTQITSRNEGSVLVIQKSRNLNKCAYRENIKQDFLATAFNTHSEIKSSPLISGDYTSQQRIKNGILEEATVKEYYIYVPFSVGTNGAKAEVVSKIKYTGNSKESPKSSVSQPRSIIFENPHIVVSPKANTEAILGAVKAVTDTIDEVVKQNTSRHFVDLIKIVREAKTDDLLGAYHQVSSGAGFSNKETAKQVFTDSLFRAGTGEAIEATIKLLQKKKLSEIEEAQVYLGLAFVQHATKPSLTAAAALLDQPDLPRIAYLGVGNLAGKYCKEHTCKNVDEFNKLIQKLISKLGDGKASNRKKENEIVYILKALANIHYISDNVVNKLVTIAKDNKQPTRVRVTALETYLADPCKDKLRDSALAILKDIQQDSELRIKAYLAVAQCPTGKVPNAIKTLLENEPSYQVGGFIVSHIRNAKASANPDKDLAKQQLGQIVFPKKFPFDFRKYSFNGEFSYAVDTLGIASSAEANVIYSQKSFLPRSTSLNLTTELFGHTFNFLEVSTRQENLDRLLEHYFGPKGTVREEYHKVVKRDVSKDDINHIGKQVQIKTNELNLDLDLDLSVKLFGSELAFFNLNDDAKKYTPEHIFEKAQEHYDKASNEIKSFEKVIRSNLLFLDAELSYPTSLGFPLRLSVEGSSAIQIKTQANIDIQSLRRTDRDNQIKVALIPSANIEIAGRLTLDAYLIENGLKVSSNVYTATGGDLRVEIFKGGQGFDVKFGVPVEEQRLISAKHEIVFNSRQPGQQEEQIPLKFSQNNELALCFDNLSPVIGLTFCGDISGPYLSGDHVPVLPFPFSGNSKYDVFVKRDDLKFYHLNFNYHNSPGKRGAEVVAEAIGLKNDKKLAITVEAFWLPDEYFKASLTSSLKSAGVEARLISRHDELSALAKAFHNKDEYYAKAGIQVSGNSDRTVYKPILEYKTPSDRGVQKPPYHLEGQVVREEKKLTFDNLRLVIPNQKNVILKGTVAEQSVGLYIVDLNLSYDKQSASIKGRYQDKPRDRKLNLELQNNFNPEANFNLKFEHVYGNNFNNDLNIQFIHGPDLSSKTNIITLSSKNILKIDKDYHVATKNEFTYPLYELKVELGFGVTPKSLDYDVDFHYKDVKVGSELDVKHCQKHMYDYDIEFEIYGMENKLEIKAKRDIITEGAKSKIQNSLEVNGKKYELGGTVNHQLKPQNINVGAELVIKAPGQPNPVKINHGLIINANEIDTHLKITTGSNVFIDTFLKAAKGGSANGSLKVNIKDHVVANGQIKAAKGSGNGEIVIEFVKRGKKVKGETTFTVHPPQVSQNQIYNVAVSVYPDFEKEPKKKITFSTENKITENSIDSVNFIEYNGKKLEANAKGSIQGQFNNGKTNGDVEIIFPNGIYTVFKYAREIAAVENVVNGHVVYSVENRDNKNTSGRKIVFKGVAKNTNVKAGILDLTYDLVADDLHGRNINAKLYIIKGVQSTRNVLSINGLLEGSIIPKSLEGKFDVIQDPTEGQWAVLFREGDDFDVKVEGEYNYEPLKSYTGAITTIIKTPYTALKLFKFNAEGVVGVPVQPIDYTTAKGSLSLLVENSANKEASVDLKTGGEFKIKKDDGLLKGTFSFQKLDPVTVGVEYGKVEGNGQSKCHSSVTLSYGKGKTVKGEIAGTYPNPNEAIFDIKLITPSDKARNIDVQLHTKKSADGSVINNDLVLTADGQKYVIDNELAFSDVNPAIKTHVKYPDGQTDKFVAELHKISDKQFQADLGIQCHKANFGIDAGIDANFENVEDFSFKVTADSESLKLKKFIFEANNKVGGKGGKRIHFSAKNADGNLLSGSTSYKAHVEGNKYIVEGSGNLKVKEESKSANFKYIRENLSTEKNGESGVQISFDAAVGAKAIDSELKVTNKQFRISNSYCEEKKQCAHIEVDSKTSANDVQNYNHELEISIDLRKLGLTHEFGLKSVTNRKQFTFDHTVDVHFQNQDNSKYQYSVYVHPKKAGVSLTTPKRLLSLEADYRYENQKFDGEVAVYLDKRKHPNEKTAILAHSSYDPNAFKFTSNLEFKSHALGRPLGVFYTSQKASDAEQGVTTELIIDIFAKQDQKIIVSSKSAYSKDKDSYTTKSYLEAKSQGLSFNVKAGNELTVQGGADYGIKYKSGIRANLKSHRYDTGVQFSASRTQIDSLVKVLNKDVLKVNSKLQIEKDIQKIESSVEIYGRPPFTTYVEVKNYNTFKYIIARKDKPNNKLEINAGFIVGQIADFRAEVHKDGAKKDLAHATIKLDETNFFKSDYAVNSENIKNYVLQPAKEDFSSQANEIKNLVPQLYKDVSEEAKKVAISGGDAEHLRPLRNYYISEGEKIKSEFLEDKTIKDINNFLKGIIGAAAQTASEIFASFSEFLESVVKTLQTNFSQVFETFNKELLPKLQETTAKIVGATTDVLEKLSEVFFTYVARVTQFLDEHQADFKEIASSINAITQDVAKFALKAYQDARELVGHQIEKLIEEIKAFPLFDELKNQFAALTSEGFNFGSEAVINTFREVSATLRDAAPTPELRKLVIVTADYIEKKLKKQKVDDAAEIRNIIEAAGAVFNRVASDIFVTDVKSPDYQRVPFFSLEYLYKLPKLVAVKFSPAAYLLSEGLQSPFDLLYSFSLNPKLYLIPISHHALVVQGKHLFTFDGKHLTFPGQCDYLLVRDALDGNFSVVGTYANGFLTAITVFDGTDSITLKKQGVVTINNGASELPIRKPNIVAYRLYNSVTIKSTAGVEVVCGLQLVACGIHVSGFYHGRLRGLLGNGDHEPYDDFTLPNGKITTSDSDFGNAYKLQGKCPSVKAVDHHGHHQAPSAACDKLFSYDSPLRFCYKFVDPGNYKTACEHGIGSGDKDVDFAVAVGYVAACNYRGIPIRVPEQFVKCQNSEQPFAIGETFSTKLPGKAADIVLLVDQIKSNEVVYKDAIQPLVQQITQQLNAKGINDVEYHLITYGGEYQKYPSHVTTADGKLTFKGKAPNIKFSEAPAAEYQIDCSKVTKNEKIKKFFETIGENIENVCIRTNKLFTELAGFVHDVNLATGNTAQAKTYDVGHNYPFRSHATRTIIAVTGQECEVGRFSALQFLRSIAYIDKQVNLNLFTPLKSLKMKNNKQTKDVIGFNKHGVFTVSQAKSHPEGSADLLKQLEYEDYCSSFTVFTDGNVFPVENIQTDKQQYVKIAAHNIVNQVVSQELGLDCECNYDGSYSGTNVCRVAYSKDRKA